MCVARDYEQELKEYVDGALKTSQRLREAISNAYLNSFAVLISYLNEPEKKQLETAINQVKFGMDFIVNRIQLYETYMQTPIRPRFAQRSGFPPSIESLGSGLAEIHKKNLLEGKQLTEWVIEMDEQQAQVMKKNLGLALDTIDGTNAELHKFMRVMDFITPLLTESEKKEMLTRLYWLRKQMAYIHDRLYYYDRVLALGQKPIYLKEGAEPEGYWRGCVVHSPTYEVEPPAFLGKGLVDRQKRNLIEGKELTEWQALGGRQKTTLIEAAFAGTKMVNLEQAKKKKKNPDKKS